MIARQELGAWLADGRERARSAAAVEHFGKTFRQRPEFARLEAELSSMETQDPQAAIEAAMRFFTDPEAVEAAVSEMIESARQDRFFRPPFRTPLSPIHTGLILFDHPSLTLLLAVLNPDALAAKRVFEEGPTSISFGGQHSAYHFFRSGSATLSFWEAPRSGADFVGDPTLRCRLVGRRAIRDGETLILDGRSQGFVIEHATSELVYFQALTPLEAAPVMAEYDSETLTFAGASSTDGLGARVTMMLSLLRLMDRTDAAPLFADLLPTLTFHGRWHAMREFLALEAEIALPHLRHMAASDPHPEVRAAAAETLAAFFPQAPIREEISCLA
jgi:hypothetical protein